MKLHHLPFWVTLLALSLFGGLAFAQDRPHPTEDSPHGQIALRAEGRHRPVEMQPDAEGFTGSFLIENVGAGPLKVTRVAVRTSPTDVRTPPGVSVELEGGGQSASIAAGETRC